MKKQVENIQISLQSSIDFFYPPFSSWISKQNFRYVACGGSNTLADIVLYFLAYNLIFKKQIVTLYFISISPYIAAFLLVFPITFLTGFLLSRYIVFPESAEKKKRIQLVKYLSVVSICILLNYGFLKFFIEQLHWWPLPSKLLTTLFVVLFSYGAQKKFAFRKSVA